MMVQYMDAMLQELNYYRDDYRQIKTVHIGGGTPSSLPIDILEKLLQRLSTLIDLKSLKEFGIEANPNDVTDEFVKLLMKYDVNRISLGVESSFQKHLIAMNRSHTVSQVNEAVSILHKNNFFNINLDFIYAWPTQTMEELKRDLHFAISLKPTHLSFYALILEPKTILFHEYQNHNLDLIDEETDASMYEYLLDELPNNGYHQYEISNFALPGFESKHNLAYWQLDEYLGIGMGAHSQIGSGRFHNFLKFKDYLESVKKTGRGIESMDPCDLIQETFIMGLRTMKGVDLDEFQNRFGVNPMIHYPRILKNIEENLLVIDNRYLRLTRKGMLLLNYVERSFI